VAAGECLEPPIWTMPLYTCLSPFF